MWRRQHGFTTSPDSPFLTLVKFHRLLHAAEAKHLRWCDVQILDKSLSTRYEKVSNIVNISKMAGHAAQQHVPFECFGIGQVVNSVKSSILDHRFDTRVWPSTPSASKKLRASFPCRTGLQETRHQPLQPPRCNGKGRGVHPVLRSGEQRSFAHTVWPLGASPFAT